MKRYLLVALSLVAAACSQPKSTQTSMVTTSTADHNCHQKECNCGLNCACNHDCECKCQD